MAFHALGQLKQWQKYAGRSPNRLTKLASSNNPYCMDNTGNIAQES
ncbi:MAG: hypothetical protein HC799_08005 [Limnothrix sp. RL_2_0]|nr:hypothetical protein [Limnothrix sp. RL_2_0]